MNARPILFSAEMIRALLTGTKTQTRRIVKPQPPSWATEFGFTAFTPNGRISARGPYEDNIGEKFIPLKYGRRGDLLWVRETHAVVGNVDPGWIIYRASGYESECRRHGFDGPPPESEITWKPSIHMERRFSRLTLRITDVRVERLQEISEADAIAEGATPHLLPLPPVPRASPMAKLPTIYQGCRDIYGSLWESINGAGSWDANPFVWCLSFEVIRANVDDVMRSKAA